MHYLSEDPWPLAGALGLVAVGFLIALKATQQGKYLVRAGIALALALLVLGVEKLWVTDNERIEAVVYDLARAVEMSDTDRVMSHLTPDVVVEVPPEIPNVTPFVRQSLGVLGRLQNQKLTQALMRSFLGSLRFDFVRVSRLTVHAGKLSKRGTAEFRTFASGTHLEPSSNIAYNFATPTSGMDWSLGFRETEPGVWKVERISPTRLPDGGTLERQSYGGIATGGL